MDKIVECVPNFSEGRDKDIINQITGEIEEVENTILLDVDPGEDTNRTVVTFVGTPDAVKKAAFKAIKKASELIDMSQHEGAHPRMGATDVCPFVPVKNVSMDDCIEIANQVGEKVGSELDIPVYLYENAATKPERQNLANIREGEYEALPEKMKNPEFKPDYGPQKFNKKSGATVIGAREFLIAYNINLNTKDAKAAKDIALELRERGRARRREKDGKIIRDEDGNALRTKGKFKSVKAIGWYVEDFKTAQISINLTNYKIANMHHVFDAAREEANKRGYRVTGSELVGLAPLDAIKQAGEYYLKKQNKICKRYMPIEGQSRGIPEKEIVDIAIKSLGLNDVTDFNPEEKIIEYKIEKEQDSSKLVDMKITEFADELSSNSPAPGGGSVAALSGSLSAALSSMVANLTYDYKYKDVKEEMEEVAIEAQKLKRKYLELIDKDTQAFNKYMKARKKGKEALEKAAKFATQVPFESLKLTGDLLELADKVAEKGNPNAVSDAAVAAILAESAAEGAYLNVKINLPTVEDEEFVKEIKSKSTEILDKIKKFKKEIVEKVEKNL
ncbi:MAG: glutamate formimidoyltransferase [Candidatus Mcinerneyibacterium aminivorans]|uniref:Formimidoyltransferase-cyclodeaminase n=1 Tax=Candidatus Mcinerneyibacterium aminivorans TaxID=2703815 RepID=A0A5D0MGB2_9BACT|nr:MAG: glutamate formimidoyltransferase [Candidatus Mcinerneyibacterium aminivorans]